MDFIPGLTVRENTKNVGKFCILVEKDILVDLLTIFVDHPRINENGRRRVMSNFSKYFSDYEKLYPEIKSRPEILEVLRFSDQKMRYAEYDLKTGRFLTDLGQQIALFLPSKEDSIERIVDEEKMYYIKSF